MMISQRIRCLTTILILLVWIGLPATAQRRLATQVHYNALEQVSTIDYPDGSHVAYAYDNEAGVQSGIDYHQASSGNTYTFVDAVTLSASGLLTGAFLTGGSLTYVYGALNRLIEQRFDFEGVTRYHAHAMTYNRWGYLSGYRRQDASLDRTLAFGFTDQGALRTFSIGSSQAVFKYDPQGNLTEIAGFDDPTAGLAIEDYDPPPGGSYDLGNHREDWLYDRAGRLLRDDANRYYYDHNGRLGMVRDLATGLPLQCNLYDGNGFRVRHTDLLKAETTYAIRDSEGRVISTKTDRADLPDRDVNHVPHNGQSIGTVSREGDGPEKAVHVYRDHLGSPAVVIDDNEIVHHEYGPYGRQMSEPRYAGAHGYTGHEDDPAAGLIYMRARYQDPVSARFLSPDPARDLDLYRPAGLNLYQYVANDPINRIDPTGETDIYIGGLNDINDKNVFNFHKKLTGVQKDRTLGYFQHHQLNEALGFAKANVGNGEPLNIIGHSYGADTAAKLAIELAKLGIKVDNLIGVDPVGKFATGRRPRVANTQNVVIVEAKPKDGNFTDFVKALGRLTGGGIPNAFKKPDAKIVVDANHASFGTLYQTEGPDKKSAQDIVDESYLPADKEEKKENQR